MTALGLGEVDTPFVPIDSSALAPHFSNVRYFRVPDPSHYDDYHHLFSGHEYHIYFEILLRNQGQEKYVYYTFYNWEPIREGYTHFTFDFANNTIALVEANIPRPLRRQYANYPLEHLPINTQSLLRIETENPQPTQDNENKIKSIFNSIESQENDDEDEENSAAIG